MQASTTRAGGCLLSLSIFLGFGAGVLTGEPVRGALVGTLAGIAIALAIWLMDRRKRG